MKTFLDHYAVLLLLLQARTLRLGWDPNPNREVLMRHLVVVQVHLAVQG